MRNRTTTTAATGLRVSANRRRRGVAVASAAALAAIAAVGGRATTAVADITGFSGFDPVNTNTAGVGSYSSDGTTFNETTAQNGEQLSGFNRTPQLITSFNATFQLTATGTADGTDFVLLNPSNGTGSLGGGGGGKGYTGITSSAALGFELFGNNVGFTTNGAAITNAVGAAPVNPNGSPILVNISYYGTTLSVTETNKLSGNSASQSFKNFNIPAAVGGNSALVGFSAATGGLNAVQAVSGFKFISNTSYTPIALTSSSFNNDMVLEKGAPQVGATSAITASMDEGTVNLQNNSWYEQGYNTAAPATGLPASGSTFTSQGDSAHVYQLQSYTGPNALLIGGAGAANTGTMTFTTPQALRALSFLTSSGNGPEGLQLTVTYANGATPSIINDVVSPDWFGAGNLAWDANGRAVPQNSSTGATTFNAVNSGNPNLWEADVLLPDTTDPIASVTLTNDTGGGRAAIFALSGAVVIGTDTLLYTGTGTPAASFDTAGSQNYTLNGGPAPFVNGDSVVYDDTATGSHTITVQAQGVTPTLLTFNGNSNYTFTGGPIVKAAALTVNGGGTVTFNDATSLTGAATINAGALTVGSSFATTSFLVASGATLNLAAAATVVGAPDVVDNGTVNVAAPVVVLGSLTGAGVINLNGTAGTTIRATGVNTAFAGSFGGTGGTFNIAAGSYAPPSASALYALTGGLNVGLVNGSAASLIVADAGGTYGTNATGGLLTLTLGPSGTLTSPAGVEGAWGGRIVLAAAAGQAAITGGASGTFDVDGPVSGVGPVLLVGANGSTVNLNAANATYTGETRLTASTSVISQNTVNLNADNGISPQSGLAFVNVNTAGGVTLNLNGHAQTVAYLTGAANTAGGNVSITGGGAVLTVNGGNVPTGGPATFSVPIQNGVTFVKSGTGNQILSANNTYSGGTVISGGTLTPLSPAGGTALGSGPVNLSGGTLALATVGTGIAGTPQVNGFANFTLTTGGGGTGANVSGGTLNLTDMTQSEANAAFTATRFSLATAGFVANFLYSTNGGADGIAFVVQNDPRGAAAVGGAGGQFGVANGAGGVLNGTNPGITNSGAVLFNVFGASNTAFGTNGILGAFQGAALYSGTLPNPVSIVYDANTQTLTESVTNADSGAVNTFAYNGVNFATLLGGNAAYVGFTGATGGVTSTQSVSNFSFGAASAVPTSIANPVIATAGTSFIQIGAGPAGNVAAVGSLTVNAGATVGVTTSVGSTYRGVLQIPTLSVAPTGKINVGANDLDLTAGGAGNDLATVTALVKAGYANGTFNGAGGITSSAALANARRTTTVGVIANNDGSGNPLYGSGATLGLFDGANPGVNDTLVKYTYYGDANLDGVVNGADYVRIDAGFAARNLASPLTGWYNGDFNYDGRVDGSDYTLIDNAFNFQTAAVTASTGVNVGPGGAPAILATSTAEVAAVPEPASLGMLAVGGLAMVGRRRRWN